MLQYKVAKNALREKLISYTYGAWGATVTSYHNGGSSTTATKNPYKYRGYYYDSDLAMYYLQTRYYDPAICRFISPDALGYLGANGDLTGYNLYAYCSNNPVNYADPSGHWIETVFDVLSLGLSVVDALINPTDIWSWVGLAGDVIDLIPVVTGVGESVDVIRFANRIDNLVDAADNIHDTAKVIDGSIDTYKNLRKINKGSGLECHHIVEKRFAPEIGFGGKENEMLSIALTHEQHVVFTSKWRGAIPYKTPYDRNKIWNAAQEIYADFPNLLEAARKTLFGG